MGNIATRTGVKLILGSAISWAEFLKDTAALTGYSLTRGIDAYSYKLSDYAKFIASLGEFRFGKQQNPITVIQSANDFLDHLHFGFLIYGTTKLIFTIMEQTDLKIITVKVEKGRAAIVTGTLRQWKNAIINILSSKKNKEACWVFSFCLDTFQQFGLQGIFHNYRKKLVDENVYLLENKK